MTMVNESMYPDFPHKPITVVLCGVGGQGTITAAHLLASAALNNGYDVKVSEIHGMAQRGGSVSTTVRFGESVSSMVCDPGQADVLVSFELMEAVRNLPMVARGGHVIANDCEIEPMPVLSGKCEMPSNLRETLEGVEGASVLVFDAEHVAQQAGNRKCANVALLGAASRYLPLTDASWRSAIEGRVPPKTLDANLAAFDASLRLVDGDGR